MNVTAVPSRFVFIALYATAILVLVDQVAELAVGLYPFQLGASQWRFGAFGLLAGRATIVVLVDALLLIAALGLGHPLVVRIWAIVHLLLGVAAIGGLALFGLDSIEIRNRVRPGGEQSFVLASVRVVIMALLLAGYCFWAGVAGLKSGRRLKREKDLEKPVLVTTRQTQ